MNYFAPYDWKTMMGLNPYGEYNTEKYHKILEENPPEFLEKYLRLPMLQRLKGIGLLCGTDWTKLYKNRFYYSRFDHSVGVALIVWHFTHNKAQTIAGLLHDVSTPVFSHVSDFRKGDALTQTATEAPNEGIIRSNKQLLELLIEDGLTVEEVEDYHQYPVADNEIPQLSADRLEYMFPSGMALDGTFDLPSIKRAYNDIVVLQNEEGLPELGFKTLEIAEDYCRRFCMIGHILQLNENKLTLQLLGQVMNLAVESDVLTEDDFMNKSEAEIMEKLEAFCKKLEKNKSTDYGFSFNHGNINHSDSENCDSRKIKLYRLYKTFRTMTEIEHTDEKLPEEDYFCINLKVKQRYINPLVKNMGRVKDCSDLARKIIDDFLEYQDTKFGCVKLVKI